jgi:small subunit ribosomal protein S8
MASTDSIADGLTKIRNASRASHAVVDVRASKVLTQLLELLKREGFIRAYKAVGTTPPQRIVRIYLKYVNRKSAITGLTRVSRPGQRIYRNARHLPRVLRGLGSAVVSTSQGMMTDRDAYRQRLGGEVMCYVW